MSATTTTTTATRSAGVLIACGVLCAALAMGLRNSFGLFLRPVADAHGWTSSGFAFAIAMQVLLNGLFQPIMGQVADRVGGRTVLIFGACLQVVGTLGMALATELSTFTLFAGLVMGLAVSSAGMPIINATLTRLLPAAQRGRAVGLGTAGSSFGQFLVVPLVSLGIGGFGWQASMIGVAACALLMIPLALPLNDRPAPRAPGATAAEEESAGRAIRRAMGDRSFWFLFFGFFVCGVHVSFLGIHLPGFVASCHLPSAVGAGAISLIGLFNIAGSLGAGELSTRWRRKWLLVGIYASRGVLMSGFLFVEKTTGSVLVFSALMGILWLSTVPPTVALCARNWGTRWLATIFGLIFLSHQVGGFTGAWLGGVIFDATGSYDLMWSICIAAAAFAALVHLPIRDAVPRAVPAAA